MHHFIYSEENKEKKRKKEKDSFIFACCRPDVEGGGGAMTPGGKDPVIKYLKMEEKEGGVIFPTIFPAEKELIGRSKKKKDRRSLTRVLKAVLFETSLAKRIRKRKVLLKLRQSSGKSSAKHGKSAEKTKENSVFPENPEIAKETIDHQPSYCSSLVSSYPRSVMSESNRSIQFDPVDCKFKLEETDDEGRGFCPNTGLYLVLFSLLALVLWGRICAILCTSTWLFFVPRWIDKKYERFRVDPPWNIDPEKEEEDL